MEANGVRLGCGVEVFGAQAHDGVGALLEVAGADVDVHHGVVRGLVPFPLAVVEQDGGSALLEREAAEPGGERAGRGSAPLVPGISTRSSPPPNVSAPPIVPTSHTGLP